MEMGIVPTALQVRLGAEATVGLLEWSEMLRREWAAETVSLSVERFERRLVEEMSKLRVDGARADAALRQDLRQEMSAGQAAVRQELAIGLSGVRQEIATSRVELLKWSFLFWMGQVVAMAGILGALLRRP